LFLSEVNFYENVYHTQNKMKILPVEEFNVCWVKKIILSNSKILDKKNI
jgi:hypothetical protein